ncbi:lytic polysaccharide monooxygenase [Gryllotalpicola reticulitermitis]|uniref:Lytic polysaccharide monooxygenase n=1 Tax=Gryllotalpicola reticulitermitis TaxID=1184153 RepID=A0ABV8QAH8_9MICO
MRSAVKPQATATETKRNEREVIMKRKRVLVTTAALACGLVMSGAFAANAATPAATSVSSFGVSTQHGYVGAVSSDVISRAAMPANKPIIGQAQYEPQSMEALKGFPAAGPADGQIASAGGKYAELDKQSATMWAKNVVKSGPINVVWKNTASHKTTKWDYFITKNGWDPNAPLTRAELEPLATIDGGGVAPGAESAHKLALPADHSGYHVILAVWEIADTANSFYNVIDVDIDGQGDGLPSLNPGDDHAADQAPTEDAPTNDQAAEDESPADDQSAGDQATDADDVTAPSAPSGLHSMGTTADSVDLMWSAASDNVGVVRYDVQRATATGALFSVGSTAKASFKDAGLRAATAYQYRIVAIDAAGNSTGSSILNVTTKGGSPSAPVDNTPATDAPASTPDSGVQAWDMRAYYNKGDRVSYNGKTYECVQSHQEVGDPGWITALSLWKAL